MKTPDEKDTTAAQEVVELWDTKLVLVSEKNTRQPSPKDANVKELVESIRATGQITPAIARPHPTKKGHLELAAGACRRCACDVLGTKLKVVVRPGMTDDELEDQILADNLQRTDPDPEAEADLIKRRLDEGASPSEIAARYGKTETWVKRRMKLLDVLPAIRKKLASGKFNWTVEMRERLGSLPDDVQKKLTENEWDIQRINSPKALEEAIARFTADLKGCSKWLNDPDTFIEGCGPGCAADSSKDLFSDGKGCGQCQNQKCFAIRSGLARDKAITTALNGRKITDVVLYTSGRYLGVVAYQGKENRVLDRYDFERHYTVSKTETDLLGLNFAIESAPKLVFLSKKKSATSGGSGSTPGKKEPRENAVIGKRLAILNKLLVSKLESAPRPQKPSILVLAATFGTRSNRADGMASKIGDWSTVDDGTTAPQLEFGHNGKLSIEDVLWRSVCRVLTSRLTFFKNGDLLSKGKQEEMKRVAGLISVDHDAEYARIATTEVRPPKSWGPDIDPITLKPVSAKSKVEGPAGTATPAKKAAAKKAPAKKAAKKASKKSKSPKA